MKTLMRRDWVRIASVAIGGVFLCQMAVYAGDLRYESYDVLQGFDNGVKSGTIGIAVQVGSCFVPGAASGLGSAMNAGKIGTVAIGVGLGAALGATPGLVTGDNQSAYIGGALGGISGGLGTYSSIKGAEGLAKTATDLGTEVGTLGSQTSNATNAINEGVAKLNSGNFLAASNKFAQAGTTLKSIAATDLAGAAKLTSLANSATALSNTTGAASGLGRAVSSLPTMIAGQSAGRMMAGVAAQEWGMSPQGAQLIGMLSSSVAGSVTGSVMSAAKETNYNTYSKINPKLAEWSASNNIWDNMKAGAVTGVGLGALQAGATIGLDKVIEKNGNLSPSSRSRLASLGGSALGSVAWGGVVGGFGKQEFEKRGDQQMRVAAIANAIETKQGYLFKSDVNTSTTGLAVGPDADALNISDSSFELPTFAQRLAEATDTGVDEKGGYKGGFAAQFASEAKDEYAKADNSGIWGGMNQVLADTNFQRSIVREGLGIGLTIALENSKKVRPQHAAAIGSAASMFLSSLPIMPVPKNEDLAKNLEKDVTFYTDRAAERATTAQRAMDSAIQYVQGKNYGIDLGQGYDKVEEIIESNNTWSAGDKETVLGHLATYDGASTEEQEALKLSKESASRLAVQERWHFEPLREPTNITKFDVVNMVAEPLIYYAVNKYLDDSTEGKSGVDLAVKNYTIMAKVALVQAATTTLLNQGLGAASMDGLEEFTSIVHSKNQHFQTNLLSFGSEAFGAQDREKTNVGQSTIYGAAQRNNQIWSFAGVDNIAQYAAAVKEQGGDWRTQVMSAMPDNIFTALTNRVSGEARHQTVRALEESAYFGMKKTAALLPDKYSFAPNVHSVSPAFEMKIIKQGGQALLDETNKAIGDSYGPPGFDPSKGMVIAGHNIGDDKSGKLIDENTATGATNPLAMGALKNINSFYFDTKKPDIFLQGK